MELDVVQNWVDVVNKQYQKLQEEEEFYLHLLGEIKKPWLLSQTPQTAQDSYYRILHQEKKDAERVTKQSQLTEELNNIDNILQKARLLHDTKTKSKDRCASNPTKSKKELRSSESKAKPSSKLQPGRSGMPRTKHLANGNGKTSNLKQRQSDSRSSSKGCTISSQKHEPPLAAATQTIPHQSTDQLHVHSTFEYPYTTNKPKEELQNIESSAITVDATKVKLEFSEFKSQLSLPPKTKKLLSSHAKFHEQAYRSWKDSICKEEMSFCKNLCKKSGCDSKYAQLHTRESLSQEAYKCIRICINAINILKYPRTKTSPSKFNPKSFDYCLASLSIDVMEEIINFLKIKSVQLSQSEALHYDDDKDIDEMTGCLGILDNLQHINGIDDDLFIPVARIIHKTLPSVRRLFNERLTYQCLTIEYQLVRKITESYFALINRLYKDQKCSVPSPELTHILQNAYGVLDNSSMLLPAFVIEK